MGKKKKQQQVNCDTPFERIDLSELDRMCEDMTTDALYSYVSAKEPYLINLAINAARIIAGLKDKIDDKDEVMYNINAIIQNYQYLIKRDW